jgi:Spy/CpxP family protein refolding chaperone
MLDRQQAEAKRAEIRRRRATAHAQIESLQADLAAADQELKQIEAASLSRREEAAEARAEMAQSRMADGGRARRRK